ncbi:MAG: ABC transporter substrate-binding protein [Anaerocolumna sp.]
MGKKILSMILVLSMFVVLLTGCGSKSDDGGNSTDTGVTNGADSEDGGETFNGVDISSPVTLKMYLLGDRTADFDKVYDEVNKILKEKLNATIEVEFLSWSEHDTKYSLLFAGSENFDLIFTASAWGHYESTVAMGGFHPLTEEFVKTYAPDIWNVVPEVAWSQAEIDGSPYMVPNYQNEFGANVVAVRGDLMEKYGYSEITSWDQLMAFYEDVATKETTITPLGTQGGGLLYSYILDQKLDTIGGAPGELFIYNNLEVNDLNVTYSLDSEAFTNYFKLAKEMYDKGYWSPDSLATTEERQDGFLSGTAASMIWNMGSAKYYAKEANKAHPEWNCTIIDVSPTVQKAVNPYINNGMAINAASKNKERAMMVLNEFYTNTDIQDLTSLGIEGTHWEAVGEEEYKLLDANANYGADNNCNWGWINTEIRRTEYVENPDNVDTVSTEILDKWNADIKAEHPYDGFSFNNANVSSETAAVSTVITQYYTPLLLGMAGDVDTALAELRTQLDKAGIQNIYDEIKKQTEEYLAK